MGKSYRNYSTTYNAPRRPFEKQRIDNELQLVGKFGLRNKREVWRVHLTLSKFRKAARQLLTLQQKDPRRLFQGAALLRRMQRYGLLTGQQLKLDYVLGLTVHKLLQRRLQSLISKNNFHAKTLHQARVIIKQGHIKIGKYLVNVPSFNVRVDSQNSFNLAPLSPFDPANKKGRAARRTQKKKKNTVPPPQK